MRNKLEHLINYTKRLFMQEFIRIKYIKINAICINTFHCSHLYLSAAAGAAYHAQNKKSCHNNS